MASHLDLDPESPWLHEAESIADATRRNAELSYEDALDFRGAQQEAFEGYLALLTGRTSASCCPGARRGTASPGAPHRAAGGRSGRRCGRSSGQGQLRRWREK